MADATGTRAAKYRYHVALCPKQTLDLQEELNHYAEHGWRVIAIDGNRVVFEEEVDE